MAMRDGDLLAAFFASVDSRIWRDDSRIMQVIKFAAVIERQQSQKFIGCHLSFKLAYPQRPTRTKMSADK